MPSELGMFLVYAGVVIADFVIANAPTIATVALAIASAGASYLMSGKTPSQPMQQTGWQINLCSNVAPMPLIYGRCRVGINRVYTGTSYIGNLVLHVIGNIAQGPIEGIVEEDGVEQVFLDDNLHTKYKRLATYEFYNGTPNQDVCGMKSSIAEWDDPKHYTAYIWMKLIFDENVFSGLPNISLVVDGKNDIFDPRDGGSVGYTRNPALIARDFIINVMGIDALRVDDASVEEAADYCDDKGWTCDYCFNADERAVDMLERILSTFRGALLFSEDTYKIKFRDLNYETPVMEIDESLVIEQSGATTLSIRQPSIFDTPNAVRMRWTNPGKLYTDDDYQLADLEAQTRDGYVKEHQIDVPAITSTDNVMKMANYFLERLQINKTASLHSHSQTMLLEPHDLIWLTHSRPGWHKKIMRITGSSLANDGVVTLSLEEELTQFYDDTYEIAPEVFYDTVLPGPGQEVLQAANVTITEQQYDYRGRTFTRLLVNYEIPGDYGWVDYCEAWLKIGEDGEWKYMTMSKDNYVIDPVEEGQTYYARIVPVSIWGSKADMDNAAIASHVVSGATGVPPDVTGLTATASGDSVSIFANEIASPDIFGYEVRSGESWTGGAMVGQNETPNIRLVGVRPGLLTLWIKAITNAGVYSANATGTQVTVFGPAHYSIIDSWYWDYDDIGTHDNTEHGTVSGEDCLKCSHTGGVLAGTWTSPVYDLGEIITARIWGDFRIETVAGAMDWATVFGAADKWGDKLAGTTRWFQAWAPEVVGGVKAKLIYGETSPPLNEITGFELAAPEVSARYVQVEFTITDPNDGTHMCVKTLNMTAAYWS